MLPISSTGYAGPDVFFVARARRFVAEVKTLHGRSLYVAEDQLAGLEEAARHLAATAIILVKFVGSRKGFRCVMHSSLRSTGKNKVVTMEEYLRAAPLSAFIG